jgi:Flp pilus assembly protein protease CpaA
VISKYRPPVFVATALRPATSLAGGAMAIILWLRHRLSRAVTPAMVLVTAADPEFYKQQMPYGAAIAVGALYVAQALLKGV